eukprot:TRINITY_DN14730_c0_g1_i1.p2 TRINITY_DN14730_c0_g1~~TRINITY_DN14730_c0_g1_i1.p2  ORF type:complete len:122 (-),score=9.63 TRINITY_DN14730_c0_g1_i1:626-991(-)
MCIRDRVSTQSTWALDKIELNRFFFLQHLTPESKVASAIAYNIYRQHRGIKEDTWIQKFCAGSAYLLNLMARIININNPRASKELMLGLFPLEHFFSFLPETSHTSKGLGNGEIFLIEIYR